jgi:hypothetical protein
LEPILAKVTSFYGNRYAVSTAAAVNFLDSIYDDVVKSLTDAAGLYVPTTRANSLKFWWSCQLSQLKDESVEANRLWVDAGRPRSGPIFSRRQTTRRAYRREIRLNQEHYKGYYSDALHDALMRKDGNCFWKSWRSKFESRPASLSVCGSVDDNFVSRKFFEHFSHTVLPNSTVRDAELRQLFDSTYAGYTGYADHGFDDLLDIDVISDVFTGLKRGKAAGPDGLSAEHLLFCHPIITSILLRLFNLFIYYGHVPTGFLTSYTVPLLKTKEYLSKSLDCSDFRGIAISNILSKCFEYCLLNQFSVYLNTGDNQFGFKTGQGCDHAIYVARKVIESYVDGGGTAQLCALDVSKAFDKVNLHGLFLKLMKRKAPRYLLDLLIYWLPNCSTCVKWKGVYSAQFGLSVGIRQGSVLAPYLFSVYMDDILTDCAGSRYGEVLLYADDILIIARSVFGLQYLLGVIELELKWLDLCLNFDKSVCLRVGLRFKVTCPAITCSTGRTLQWVACVRYLGTYFLSGYRFSSSLDLNKRAFCRAVNSIIGKIGNSSHEDVILHLIRSKCIPILMYGTECLNLNKRALASLDFCVTRFLMKIFKSTNRSLIDDCLNYFNFCLPSVLVAGRAKRLQARLRLSARNNTLLLRFLDL